jgi:hypothetical protein
VRQATNAFLFTQLLQGTARWSHRVSVQRGDGTWEDWTHRFLSASWSEDADAGTAAGTVRFRREARVGATLGSGGTPGAAGSVVSLSPLDATSPANLVGGTTVDPLFTPFRGIRLVSAVTAIVPDPPTGAFNPPAEDDYAVVFDGVMDDPSFGGRASVVEVPIRDRAARLQDAIIEVERPYGSDAGTEIETVLAAILSDNGFAAEAAALRVLGDTEGWSLKPYKQALGVSVWEACRSLVLRMGWDFRYWWHPDGAFVPTLLRPTRLVDLATYQNFPPTVLRDVPRLTLKATDIRNAGRLFYTNRSTGTVASVTAEDPDSIDQYGRRAFGIDESQEYPRDAGEAQQMLDAAVADLSTPYLEHDVVLTYWWPIQLGDGVGFDPQITPTVPRLYPAATTFGVTRVQHDIDAAGHAAGQRTTLSLRGRPVGAFRRWQRLAQDAPALAALAQQITTTVTTTVTDTVTTQIITGAVPSPLTLLAPSAGLALTAMPAGATELAGGLLRQRARLVGATRAKLSARVQTAGASTATLRPQWATADGGTWADLLAPVGGTPTANTRVALATTGTNHHPPQPIDPAALTASTTNGDVLVRLIGEGGDGSAAPVLGSVSLLFFGPTPPDAPGDPLVTVVATLQFLPGAGGANASAVGAYSSGYIVNGLDGAVDCTLHTATVTASGRANPSPPPANLITTTGATAAAPYPFDPDVVPISNYRVEVTITGDTAGTPYANPSVYAPLGGDRYRVAGAPGLRVAAGQLCAYFTFALVGSTNNTGNGTPQSRGPVTFADPVLVPL